MHGGLRDVGLLYYPQSHGLGCGRAFTIRPHSRSASFRRAFNRKVT